MGVPAHVRLLQHRICHRVGMGEAVRALYILNDTGETKSAGDTCSLEEPRAQQVSSHLA